MEFWSRVDDNTTRVTGGNNALSVRGVLQQKKILDTLLIGMDEPRYQNNQPQNLKRSMSADDARQRKKFRPEEKPFVCECGRSFTLKGNLTKHQRLHTNEKPFKCDIPNCAKTFTQAIGLTRHMMTHNNEKPYTCPMDGCTKAFAQPGNLNAHLRIHTGDKPFVCPSCNRAFAQKGNLTTHMLYHSTEKPFLCQVPGCGQAFSLKGNLKKHAKIHQEKGDVMPQDPMFWAQGGMPNYQGFVPTDQDYSQYAMHPMMQFQHEQQYYFNVYRNHLIMQGQDPSLLLQQPQQPQMGVEWKWMEDGTAVPVVPHDHRTDQDVTAPALMHDGSMFPENPEAPSIETNTGSHEQNL